jgi:hypothetical protein
MSRIFIAALLALAVCTGQASQPKPKPAPVPAQSELAKAKAQAQQASRLRAGMSGTSVPSFFEVTKNTQRGTGARQITNTTMAWTYMPSEPEKPKKWIVQITNGTIVSVSVVDVSR